MSIDYLEVKCLIQARTEACSQSFDLAIGIGITARCYADSTHIGPRK